MFNCPEKILEMEETVKVFEIQSQCQNTIKLDII